MGGGVKFDPETTRWCLCLYETPHAGRARPAITLSPFRRPTLETAPVDAKAGCLYPNGSRALIEAGHRGFDNCLMNDVLGNVAELANSNVFMAKDGVVFTPAPNGTFLDGITRRRVIGLLRADGVEVVETPCAMPTSRARTRFSPPATSPRSRAITRIDERPLGSGPLTRRASALYRDFAHATAPVALASLGARLQGLRRGCRSASWVRRDAVGVVSSRE